MKNNFKTYIIIILVLVFGIVIGALVFSSDQSEANQSHNSNVQADEVWTCSMHPQIRKDKAGDCPICGMELIPASKIENSIDPDAIKMSKTARQLARVETTVIGSQSQVPEIELSGQLKINQNQTQSITVNFDARIESLFINETGEKVNKGQVIAELYAPDIQLLKQEWELAKRQKNNELIKRLKSKIQNYELTISDIESIKNGILQLKSPLTGFVNSINAQQGDNLKADQKLLSIADLSTIWAVVDIYEGDFDQINLGDELLLQIPQHQDFTGKVSFISPFLDNTTRSAQARVVINNQDQSLKPGTFITAKLTKSTQKSTINKSLMIPKSALLWTGKRSVVYQQLENENGVYFKMREVEIGKTTSNSVEIIAGLESGDQIVTHGAFSIDSEAQLADKRSMMNPKDNESNNHTKNLSRSQKTDQLKPLVNQYIKLKDALVSDDLELAKMHYKKANNLLAKMDIESFQNLDQMLSIDQLREEFINMSEAIIELTQALNPMDQTLYIQRCPMADRGKGARWLSFSKQIRNPYYGASMLKCGAVKDSID